MIITELGLSQRTEHALRRNGIHSTEQLTQMGDAQILRLRGMGPAMLREIREKLARPERSEAEELAAYRATGLTPEEIERIVDAYGRGHTLRTESAERLEIVREIKTDRLRELANAEQDGRLVVLPAKTVFALVMDAGPDCDLKCPVDSWDESLGCDVCSKAEQFIYEIPCTQERLKELGKTVFLTREEAEAALERKEEN